VRVQLGQPGKAGGRGLFPVYHPLIVQLF
jgi:hypothetical protein